MHVESKSRYDGRHRWETVWTLLASQQRPVYKYALRSVHGAIKPRTFIRFFHGFNGKYYSVISNRDVDLLKSVERNFKFSLKIQNSFEGWSVVIIKKNINKFFITEIWNSLNAVHSSPRSTSISNRYPRYYGEISISWYVEKTIVEAKTSSCWTSHSKSSRKIFVKGWYINTWFALLS